MVLQLLLMLPVELCSCEAVELSFSCLRRLKTLSKGGKRVCGKKTTFMSYGQIKHCLLASSVLPPWLRWRQCVRFLICYIFGGRPKGGTWPKWPNGKYASVGNTYSDALSLRYFIVHALLFYDVCTVNNDSNNLAYRFAAPRRRRPNAG